MPEPAGTTLLERLMARHAAERAAKALARTRHVLARLRERGVEAKLVGSLARGDSMAHANVDFLIVSCPYELKCRLEALIEDVMAELPFDCVYLDEARPPFRERLPAETRDAPATRHSGAERARRSFLAAKHQAAHNINIAFMVAPWAAHRGLSRLGPGAGYPQQPARQGTEEIMLDLHSADAPHTDRKLAGEMLRHSAARADALAIAGGGNLSRRGFEHVCLAINHCPVGAEPADVL